MNASQEKAAKFLHWVRNKASESQLCMNKKYHFLGGEIENDAAGIPLSECFARQLYLCRQPRNCNSSVWRESRQVTYLREVPLPSSTLDVERQDPQRRNLVPLPLAWVTLHMVEEYIHLDLTARALLGVRSHRVRALGKLHPARPRNFLVHLNMRMKSTSSRQRKHRLQPAV